MSAPRKNGSGRASFVPALTACSIVVGACAALLMLTPMPATAQQSGGARAPISNGGSHATVGAGATGAANRGGAGGVMNPSPGGSRPEAGEPGYSAGPTGTSTQRSGYLGGRDTTTTESGGDTGTSTTNTVNVVVPRGLGNEVNCHDFSPSDMTPTARLSGQNMVRIEDVRALIGEGAASKAGLRPSRYLLANFQEELAKPHPDLAAAGTYLGIAAQDPVTPQLVLRASRILCVPMNATEAASISSVAEQQRLWLRDK